VHEDATPAPPAYVTSYTLTSALGAGNDATLDALRAHRGGLRSSSLRAGGTTWLGLVDGLDEDAAAITGALRVFDCRANRMLRRALAQDGFMRDVARARDRYGPRRVACFVGTIGGGLEDLEQRYRRYDPGAGDLGPAARLECTAHLYAAPEYCRHLLGITGPAATISTACSSSAKVFCSAYRYLAAGLCDAAVVGGVDCANETFVYGFRALGLLSSSPCRPWDRDRDGLSVGEAAGFALLEREPRAGDGGIALLGFGESADAYHMTAPHPEGNGAEAAMRAALGQAGLRPGDIDYINLHGSGTPANDASEDRAVHRLFGSGIPCSGTKGWTGHTQGAAGIAEAVLSMLSIRHAFIPATLNTAEPDPSLNSRIVLRNVAQPVRRVLTNSFGFGGSNCALIFGAAR
jgi:3-oxoacyl-[acyl-carrier-protein] synthase I